MNRTAFAAAAGAILLTGCTVGPKYVMPQVPTTQAFKEPLPEQFKESKDWQLAHPGQPDLPPDWWQVFGDPVLTGLEEKAAANNQDLTAAEARFREARATIRFNRAAEFPTVTVGPGISSLRDSGNRPYFGAAAKAVGDFTLPFDLSYEVDLWGRIGRSVTAAREEAQATGADLAAAKLSIQAEVAFDYFEVRSADAQKRLLDDTVKAYTDALQLTVNRFEGGVAPKADVAQAQTQLDTTRAQDTDIDSQRAQFEHAIAVLIGEPPASFTLAPSPEALKVPSFPVSVPSQLLERRPDIAAAERRVAASNEQIGIARAAFFPVLSIGASAGLEGTSLLNWFNWPSRFWSVGPSMAQTLFDAGRRRSVSDAAIANYDATVAEYRETALTAFQQVEDSLAALRVLEQEAKQQHDAVNSAQESLQIFTNRYQGGVDNYLQVINAQTIDLTNQRTEIDILRRRMEASVLLIKALGGGWSTAALPSVGP